MKPILVAKKIAKGINFKYGSHIVINTSEFYGGEGNLVRLYVVRDAYYSREGDYVNEELFKSASAVFTVLFMRDLLYFLDGKEIPSDDDDPGWKAQKAKKNVDKAMAYMQENYIMDIVEVDNERFAIT